MIKRDKRGNKKGQVTLFIIIAVVVVALGIVTWFLWPQLENVFMSEAEAQAFLAREGANLKTNVHECIKMVSEDIIREQGLHAGYYFIPTYSIPYAGTGKVVVMYKDENKFRLNELPSLDAIKAEFARALELEGDGRIYSCLNDFEDFKRRMEVELGSKKITPEIYDEEVVIRVDWPIKVTKARASSTLQQKDITLLIPLGRVWTVANDIVTYEVNQTEFIWVYENYISQHDSIMLKTHVEPLNYPTSETTIYMITTRPYRPGESEFLFHFAVDRRS